MSQEDDTFSARRGYDPFDVPIRIREGAPAEIRQAVLHFALDCGLVPHAARAMILEIMNVPPEPNNWSSDSNKINEAQRHLGAANWFEVYDVAEAFADHLARYSPGTQDQYGDRLNKALARFGVGWKLVNGRIEVRGSEAFESQIARAVVVLQETGFSEARREVHESLRDLSRRPTPDLTGAVHHAMGALEAVSREATGQRSPTLGQILRSERDLFPPPLGEALEKLWGFASERARHVREGGTVAQPEAELLVGLAAVAVAYLCSKLGGKWPAG